MRECIECGTAFEAPNGRLKVCSDKCRNARQNRYRRRWRAATGRKVDPADYPPKTCLHCGRTFQPSKGNWARAKYCTPTCARRKDTEENRRLRWVENRTIKCRECGAVTEPLRLNATTCGKRHCVDESRRKTKRRNYAKAVKKGGHRYEKYREYQNAYQKKWASERYRTDPKHNLSARMRGALRQALRRKGLGASAKNAPTFTLLGYSREELYHHIESFFTEENGYSWDNMSEWHIDHIRPVASFTFDSVDDPEFKACWALENLQPLWTTDNLSKGAKWNGE